MHEVDNAAWVGVSQTVGGGNAREFHSAWRVVTLKGVVAAAEDR